MDKAIADVARIDYCRADVYRDDFDVLIKHIGGCDVTYRALTLGARDSTTGWYAKGFTESTIKMVIQDRAGATVPLPPGVYVRLDAVAICADGIEEGDEVKTANNKYYEVKAVKERWIGDCFWFRECDLTFLPFKNLHGKSYTPSSVEDARYKIKDWLQKRLSSSALPNYIVGYGEPDYPLTRVFKQKGMDLTWCVMEPATTPMIDAVSNAPYGYAEAVPIIHYCIDKDNISGAKLKWQAETELRRIAQEDPIGSLRQLERRRNMDQDLGSTRLYGTEWILNYERDAE